MKKGFIGSAKSYTKNVGKLLVRVATRKKPPSEALEQLKKDTRKLKHTLTRREGPTGNRKEAARFVEDGRQAYNGGHYNRAESYFKRALIEDDSNAWAFTYLGHSKYKQGRRDEAVAFWERAIECEPDSDAARKARKKLQHVAKTKHRVAHELEDRLRNL